MHLHQPQWVHFARPRSKFDGRNLKLPMSGACYWLKMRKTTRLSIESADWNCSFRPLLMNLCFSVIKIEGYPGQPEIKKSLLVLYSCAPSPPHGHLGIDFRGGQRRGLESDSARPVRFSPVGFTFCSYLYSYILCTVSTGRTVLLPRLSRVSHFSETMRPFLVAAACRRGSLKSRSLHSVLLL